MKRRYQIKGDIMSEEKILKDFFAKNPIGDGNLYSVKEVLKLCHTTRKQLLYYEQKGLISAVRNENNNYRYYDENELTKLDFIIQCRNNGFSLSSIQEMMLNQDLKTLKKSIKEAMRNAREDLDESVARYERNMERYNTMLEAVYFIADNTDIQSIEMIEIPANNIVYYDFEGSFFNQTFKYYIELSKLEGIMQKYNFNRLSFRMYQFFNHFNADTGEFHNEKSKIRLFYTVKENMSDCPNFMKCKARKALSAVSVGNYGEDLIKTYKRIIDYAKENGIKLDPVSEEEALLDPSVAYDNKDFWVTRVSIFLSED